MKRYSLSGKKKLCWPWCNSIYAKCTACVCVCVRNNFRSSLCFVLSRCHKLFIWIACTFGFSRDFQILYSNHTPSALFNAPHPIQSSTLPSTLFPIMQSWRWRRHCLVVYWNHWKFSWARCCSRSTRRTALSRDSRTVCRPVRRGRCSVWVYMWQFLMLKVWRERRKSSLLCREATRL